MQSPRAAELLKFFTGLVASCVLLLTPPCAEAAHKTDFRIAWSLYVGWLPWDYAARSGILKKWATRYGLTIDLVRAEDYGKSITDFTAGRFDGCAMTNIDVLTVPAAAGLDSTILIVGSFSNGNDAIVAKGKGRSLASLKGQPVNLVANSVSHYLLARAMEIAGMNEKDVRIIDTADADLVQRFSQPGVVAAVTWKPHVGELMALPDTELVFDSRRIPGEIVDLMVVNSAVLRENPDLGRALVGAWYEALTVLFAQNQKGTAALTAMAKASGTDLADLKSQLATTKMFTSPAEAHGFMSGSSVARTMELTRAFSFTHNLLGAKAKNVDSVGILFPRGNVLGDANHVKVRIDASYTRSAADGKL